MVKCDLVQGCHFTTDFSNKMPSQLAIIKREYCNHDFHECARYMAAMKLDSGNVPHDLHPGDIEQAHLIIKSFAE